MPPPLVSPGAERGFRGKAGLGKGGSAGSEGTPGALGGRTDDWRGPLPNQRDQAWLGGGDTGDWGSWGRVPRSRLTLKQGLLHFLLE